MSNNNSNNVALIECLYAEVAAVAVTEGPELAEALEAEAQLLAARALHYSASGQSGPDLEYGWNKLNAKEQSVVRLLASDDAEALTLNDVAAMFHADFGAKVEKYISKSGKVRTEDRGNSWARNSLRKLVRAGWVERVDAGTYAVTEAGKLNMRRALMPKRTKTLSVGTVAPAAPEVHASH